MSHDLLQSWQHKTQFQLYRVLGTWHLAKSYLKNVSPLALGKELFKIIKTCFSAECGTMALDKELFKKIKNISSPSAKNWHSAKIYLIFFAECHNSNTRQRGHHS